MKRAISLLAVLVLLQGCAALPEEDRSFAVVLGLDRQAGEWLAYVRIPSYQQEGGYLTLSARGGALGEAMAQLEAASPMALHYGQLRMIVCSRRLAESGDFPGVLDALASRGGVRGQAALAVTEDDLAEAMEAMNPPTGTRLSKSLEAMMASRREQGILPDATLSAVRRMGERQQPVLMGLTAGEGMQLSGGWLVGADGQVHARLTAQEQQLLALLSGSFRQGILSLGEGTLTVTEAHSRVRLRGMSAVGSIRLRCTSSSFSEEGAARGLEEALTGLSAKLAASGCDALGLARQAMAGCATMEAWHSMAWHARYSALTWQVSVRVEREA